MPLYSCTHRKRSPPEPSWSLAARGRLKFFACHAPCHKHSRGMVRPNTRDLRCHSTQKDTSHPGRYTFILFTSVTMPVRNVAAQWRARQTARPPTHEDITLKSSSNHACQQRGCRTITAPAMAAIGHPQPGGA